MSFVVRWCLLWCMSSFSATLCAGPVIDLKVPQGTLRYPRLLHPTRSLCCAAGWSSVAESPDALQSPPFRLHDLAACYAA